MKYRTRIVVGSLVGLFLIYGLSVMVELDLSDLQGRPFNAGWALAALMGYFPCALIRAFRMRHFAQETYGDQGLVNMTSVLVSHQAANHFFPMKLGEFVYPTLMRLMGGRTLVSGIGATLLMRFADLVGLSVVVCVAAVTLVDLEPAIRAVLIVGSIFGALSGGLGMARSDFFFKLLSPVLRPLAPSTLDRVMADLTEALAAMDKSTTTWLAVFVESTVLWIGLVGVHCALGCAFGLCLSPALMAVGALGSILCSYIPVGTVLNLGTVEFGWVATMPLAGVTAKEALLIGGSIHLSLAAITLCYALLGLPLLAFRRRRDVSSGEDPG